MYLGNSFISRFISVNLTINKHFRLKIYIFHCFFFSMYHHHHWVLGGMLNSSVESWVRPTLSIVIQSMTVKLQPCLCFRACGQGHVKLKAPCKKQCEDSMLSWQCGTVHKFEFVLHFDRCDTVTVSPNYITLIYFFLSLLLSLLLSSSLSSSSSSPEKSIFIMHHHQGRWSLSSSFWKVHFFHANPGCWLFTSY